MRIIKSTRAFSLVEVVLCVGIVVFVGILLVGLIPVGLQSSRDAAEIARTTAIMEAIEQDLHILSKVGSSPLGLPAELSTTSLQTNIFTGFFDDSGRVRSSPIDARFGVQIRKSAMGRRAPGDTNFPAFHYGIQIWWPAMASKENAGGVFHSQATLLRNSPTSD